MSNKSEKQKDGLAAGAGALGALALLGGAMSRSDIGIANHTFCEDCLYWLRTTPITSSDEPTDGRCRSRTVVFYGMTAITEEIGPLWPGCRGFSHRPGTPGPMKRWAAVTKAASEAAIAKAKEGWPK
jgi:hypothetical protein